MHVFLLTLALAALPGGDGPSPVSRPLLRIEMKVEAQIRGTQVLLRDVADVGGNDAVLVERVQQLALGRRPAPGFSRTLGVDEVRARLAETGLAADAVAWSGPRETGLVPLFAQLQPKELLAVAEPVLRAVLEQAAASDVELEVLTQLGVTQVPPGRRSLDLRARLRDRALTETSAVVDVEVLVDDEVFRTLPVSFRLKHFAHAVVVVRPARRGQPLTEECLELRRIPVSPLRPAAFQSLEELAGKVAARDLQANRPLALADVAEPAIVRKDEPVTVIATRGTVRVATRGLALQDGARGARILVRNLGSERVLAAVIVAPGTVLIETER